jgi:hypothetical protein
MHQGVLEKVDAAGSYVVYLFRDCRIDILVAKYSQVREGRRVAIPIATASILKHCYLLRQCSARDQKCYCKKEFSFHKFQKYENALSFNLG